MSRIFALALYSVVSSSAIGQVPGLSENGRAKVGEAVQRAEQASDNAAKAAADAIAFKGQMDGIIVLASDAARRAKTGEQGFGHLEGRSSSGDTWSYWGQVSSGERAGYGEQRWHRTGSIITGKFLNGGHDGLFSEKQQDGSIQFYQQIGSTGTGKYCYTTWADGEFYAGECAKPGMLAHGVFTTTDTVLSGCFEDTGEGTSMKTGYAVFSSRGTRIVGHFVGGLVNGYARVTKNGTLVSEGYLLMKGGADKMLYVVPRPD